MAEPPRRRLPVHFGGRLGYGFSRPLGDGAAFGRYGISFVVLVVLLGGAALHQSSARFSWVAAISLAFAVSAARAREATRARVEAGVAIAIAALGAAPHSSLFAVAAAAGVWISAAAALSAIGEIDAPACVAAGRALAWRPWQVALALASALAFATLFRFLGPSAGVACVAGIAMIVLAAACLRAGVARRLELGVPEKTRVGVVVTIVASCATVLVVLADRSSLLQAPSVAALAVATVIVRIAIAADAARVALWSRTIVALLFAGAPLALLAFIAADDGNAPILAVGCVVVALAVGASSRSIAASLRPANGAWLDAVALSRSAMKQDGSDDALRFALAALREPVKHVRATAEIILLDPLQTISVDAAGYARTRAEALPASLVDIASREPDATLRAEVLDELEVRRPDLRSLGRWMEERGALAVTVVANAGEPIALLVIPRGARVDLVTLEEVRAFKLLADDFSGVCIVRAALARGVARQVDAAARIEEAVERQGELEHLLAFEVERHTLATARLARPAAVGVYSAGVRLALEALERKCRSGAPITVFAPPGVDPVPLLARAHLAGARGAGPFVVVDGTSNREHDLDRWRDAAASPLVLSDRGLLLLVDGAALPRDVQRTIGEALAERRSPSSGARSLDVQIALTSARAELFSPDSTILDPLLASRFAASLTSPITFPRLDERAEDLRALVTDLLAREGVRARGDAVGIDDRAFIKLVDYTFPGGDAELVAIMRRLVASAGADGVVREADVVGLGLDLPLDEASASSRKIRLL